jgi:phage terminase large subunit-like protein
MGVQPIKFENRRGYLPTQALWLEEYIREITGLPGSKYDDQVDSNRQALKAMFSLSANIGKPAYSFGPPRVYET